MHILAIAGWYPNKNNPLEGIFIKEHCEAVAPFIDLQSIIYLTTVKSNFGFSITTNELIRDNIIEYHVKIVMPVRRYGIHDLIARIILKRLIKRIKIKCPIDLCHIHVRTHITKLVTQLKAIACVPVVVTEHFSFYHTGINQLSLEAQRVQEKEIAEWFNNVQIKKIMPVSKQLADVLMNRFNVIPGRFEIIPNIASEDFYFSDQIYPSSDSVGFVLAAFWKEPKNPFIFLDALSTLSHEALSNIEVHWIGNGPQMDRVKEIVDAIAVKNITFYGLQSKSFIADMLKRNHYLVHPSDAENLPCIIAESLACGTPVISMNINGIPEMVGTHNGILVEPGNIKALAGAIATGISKANDWDRREIAKEAEGLYSKQAVGQKIYGVYKEVLNE